MIWVIAGTLDGRNLAVAVQEHTGLPVLVSVVSQYGAQLASHPGIEVHEGRLNLEEMKALIQNKGITMLIDASHPYAAIVTATAREAAADMEIPFIRFERKEVPLPEYDKLHHVSNEEEAATLAGKLGKEVWTRVLPTAEVLQMMEDLGVSPKYTIAMQGPFSYDMNKVMFQDTKAEVVVMKNSGLVGGSDTKLQAAIDLDVHVIVIDRPTPAKGAVTISTVEEFKTLWEDYDGLH